MIPLSEWKSRVVIPLSELKSRVVIPPSELKSEVVIPLSELKSWVVIPLSELKWKSWVYASEIPLLWSLSHTQEGLWLVWVTVVSNPLLLLEHHLRLSVEALE